MTDNPYWLVSGLSYEDTIRLAAAICVENFQRDARTGDTKFWPGDHAVFEHLYHQSAPSTKIIRADGNAAVWRENFRLLKIT
jgi:hypothetical protein